MVCIYNMPKRINICLCVVDVKFGYDWKTQETMKRKANLRFSAAILIPIVTLLGAKASRGQTVTAYPMNTATQSTSGTTGTPLNSQNPFLGSVPEGKITGNVLALSFKDAIDHGLRNNLGLLLQSDTSIAARSQRWKELSHLLPNLTTGTSENLEQINLAAEGIRIPGIPSIIGPFGYFDTRAYLTQTLFDYSRLQRERGAASSEQAAQYSYKDARDLVVLAVGNAYLQSLAGAARVETAQAQVTTAQALYDRAVDQQKAGVAPAIDTLRAQVELQARQQQLIVARNSYAKEKLGLARVIGLPPGQEFTLSDTAPYEPLATLGLEQALQRAYATRSDYQAALQRVRAAQQMRNAATAEHFPTLNFSGNYGAIGTNPGNSHGSFLVTGTLNIPIFQGGKIHSDVLEAEATLRQRRQELDNLRGQIDYDVRTALLDLTAASDQVQVARSSVDLANQTVIQARDRFIAGVTDNLEVVQAQEAVAQANENYISSLYAHNLAKVSLARALGMAEEAVKQYLKSK